MFEDIPLLLLIHSGRILMRVSMKTTRGSAMKHNYTYISCPASLTAAICSGNVSRLCPGMNHVVFIPSFSNNLNRRTEPTSPAYIPYLFSMGYHNALPLRYPQDCLPRCTSPAYCYLISGCDSITTHHPDTASTSTPNEHRIRLVDMVSSGRVARG
jgi:hypothetical protein